MFKQRKHHIFLLIVVVTVLLIVTYLKCTSEVDMGVPEELSLTYNVSDRKLFEITLHYTISSPPCNASHELLAVVLVTSYFGNVETRSAMRRAFAGQELEGMGVRRVFLLGRNDGDRFTKQTAVEHEARRFRDVLQGDFVEAYRNLTYKHLMGLRWAAENCKNARYVIKMDDDIVVDVRRMVAFLQSTRLPQPDFLAGYVLHNMPAIREPANKWYVTSSEYADNTYPDFLSGWFYITNPATCTKLVALSRYRPYFWIDDTYITGILADLIKVRHHSLNKLFTPHVEYMRCCVEDIRRRRLECEFMVGPNGGDNNFFFEFNDAVAKCGCGSRNRPMNETCVAERKFNLGRGTSVIESYKLV